MERKLGNESFTPGEPAITSDKIKDRVINRFGKTAMDKNGITQQGNLTIKTTAETLDMDNEGLLTRYIAVAYDNKTPIVVREFKLRNNDKHTVTEEQSRYALRRHVGLDVYIGLEFSESRTFGENPNKRESITVDYLSKRNTPITELEMKTQKMIAEFLGL